MRVTKTDPTQTQRLKDWTFREITLPILPISQSVKNIFNVHFKIVPNAKFRCEATAACKTTKRKTAQQPRIFLNKKTIARALDVRKKNCFNISNQSVTLLGTPTTLMFDR